MPPDYQSMTTLVAHGLEAGLIVVNTDAVGDEAGNVERPLHRAARPFRRCEGSCPGSSGLMVPLVTPQLRDEAPSPGLMASKAATERPARTSVNPAQSPV